MAPTFISSILIINLICSQIGPSSTSKPFSTNNSTEFIKTSCSNTTYPLLCITSLSEYATKIRTDPKLLATTALSVTLEAARSASMVMDKMSKDGKGSGSSGRESSAVAECVEELGDAVEELKSALGEMGEGEGMKMNDVETWLSSALTDDDTCLDGFSENGGVDESVKRQVVRVAHLTSNALALIHNYGSSYKM